MRTRLIVLAVLAIVALVVLVNTVLVVDAGQIAVVFNSLTGHLSSREPGTHLMIPGVQKAILYDSRVQTYTMSAAYNEGEIKGDDALDATTQDGQVVKVDVSVRFHVDATKVTDLHQHIGVDFVDKVVRPEVRTTVRLTVANYPVTEVYSSKRLEVQTKSLEALRPRFLASYLVIDEVLIRRVAFDPEFQKAIEAKQIAQQQAQQMEYVLEKEKLEKERKIIEAQGEAEAIRLKGVALANNPALIQYEYVQKITPGITTIITDGKSIMNLGDIMKKD
jgi:regulator of protease activity HflC (stomatin/prohibitin superfamily)